MRFNLHYKITLLIILIVAVVFGGVYFYLNTVLKDYAYQRVRDNLQERLGFVKLLVEPSWFSGGRSAEIHSRLVIISQILRTRVSIFDLAGQMVGDSESPVNESREGFASGIRLEIDSALQGLRGESRRYHFGTRQEYLFMAESLGHPDRFGILRVGIPLKDDDQLSLNLRRGLLISFLIVFIILSMIFSFIAAVFISRPIREIARTAGAIANGEFPAKLDIRSSDEMEDLSKSLNDMSDHSKSRIREVVSSRSRLEAVFLSMTEGVMIVDGQGVIRLMNQSLRDFLRVEREPSGLQPLEVIRNIEIQEMVDKILRPHGGSQSREIKVLIPDERILSVHATPVVRDGRIDGAVMTFHDITNLRQLEKVRQDFVANVSHELRTPISTIKGYAETLLNGALDDKENAQDFLRIICEDSDRLAKLINDLLDLSKIESGTLVLRPGKISLQPAIDRVLAALRNQIEEKKIMVEVELDSQLPPVHVDENSLAQILLNLIENAVKYNHPAGRIWISARDQKRMVEVQIRDSGLGIPAKDTNRIFERFYRVDKAHSRSIGGTGLGLSIVKHLVQSHGGTIQVESEAGVGSTFYVSLPKQ